MTPPNPRTKRLLRLKKDPNPCTRVLSGAAHEVSATPLPSGSIALQTQYSLHVPLPTDEPCATGTIVLWAEDGAGVNVGFGVDVPLTVPVGPATDCKRHHTCLMPLA